MSQRRLTLLLAASLVANLFLAGALFGAARFGGGREDRPRRSSPFAAAAGKLDAADAQALRAVLRERAETAKPRVRALREARREVQAAMVSGAYDPAAVRAAQTRVRAQEAALRDEVDGTLIDFAARLDPGERAAVAPLLRHGGRGSRREGSHRGGRERSR